MDFLSFAMHIKAAYAVYIRKAIFIAGFPIIDENDFKKHTWDNIFAVYFAVSVVWLVAGICERLVQLRWILTPSGLEDRVVISAPGEFKGTDLRLRPIAFGRWPEDDDGSSNATDTDDLDSYHRFVASVGTLLALLLFVLFLRQRLGPYCVVSVLAYVTVLFCFPSLIRECLFRCWMNLGYARSGAVRGQCLMVHIMCIFAGWKVIATDKDNTTWNGGRGCEVFLDYRTGRQRWKFRQHEVCVLVGRRGKNDEVWIVCPSVESAKKVARNVDKYKHRKKIGQVVPCWVPLFIAILEFADALLSRQGSEKPWPGVGAIDEAAVWYLVMAVATRYVQSNSGYDIFEVAGKNIRIKHLPQASPFQPYREPELSVDDEGTLVILWAPRSHHIHTPGSVTIDLSDSQLSESSNSSSPRKIVRHSSKCKRFRDCICRGEG